MRTPALGREGAAAEDSANSTAPTPLIFCDMDNLEEDLTCSVCYSLFSDPRVLPCSHTFCKSCLENVLQVSVNFSIWRPLRLPLKCPNCRSLSELPAGAGVDSLPANVSLRGIVEKFRRESRPRIPECPEHPGQPLNVYCVQDCELICGVCLTVGQHRGHRIDDLEMAYVKERDAPAKLIERLTDDRFKEVCKLVERLEQEKARHHSLVRQNREVVERFFQDLERLLAHKKDLFVKALDRACVQTACSFNPLIEKLKDMEEEQLELLDLSANVEEETSPLVFLEKVRQLRVRVDALTRAPLPDVPSLKIAPDVADFLERRWMNLTLARLQEAPVPKISCSVEGKGAEKVDDVEAGQKRFAFRVPGLNSVISFVVLFFLLLLFFLNPVSGASLGFSVLAQVSQALESLVAKLLSPFQGYGTLLYCLLRDWSLKIGASVSAFRDSVCQHVAYFCQTLRLC